MTYENLVKAAKKAVKPVDVKVIKEHLAVEFDIEGAGEGAFYVEFTEKKVEVEPYEYYDHNFRVRTDADTAVKILSGDVSPVAASEEGKAIVEGDAGKLALLEKYLKADVVEKKSTKTATKTPAKVPVKAEKKPVPKKTPKKPAKK